MLSALIFGLTTIAALTRDTIIVSPRGEIRTITAAIARAHPSGVIRVLPGVYAEPMLVVDKPLTLVGDGRPVLDGRSAHQIMSITADDVTVRGFVFRNVGTSFVEDRAAVKVTKARGCTISDNRLERAFFGIYLAAVSDCRLTDNIIVGAAATEAAAGNGIHLWTSHHILIRGNHISGHRDGIYF